MNELDRDLLSDTEEKEYQRLKGLEELARAMGKPLPKHIEEKLEIYRKRVRESITEKTEIVEDAGDENLVEADEREKWLKENWETVMKQLDELKLKIEEKEKKIEELKSKGTGASRVDIYLNKCEQIEQKKELVSLYKQYHTIKWLKENGERVMKQLDELKRKIEEREKEIEELKSKGTGASGEDIYQNKKREFELKDELLDLEDQYKSLKTELDEKLGRYDGFKSHLFLK